MTTTFQPNLDRLIRIEEVLGPDLHPQVVAPVLRAQARGVIGWCVAAPDQVCELYAHKFEPLNLHDLPVPVAGQAFVNDWLPWEEFHLVLQARGQIMGPGDEGIFPDDDGHFEAICHCGWNELCRNEGEAERQLDSHLGSHLV